MCSFRLYFGNHQLYIQLNKKILFALFFYWQTKLFENVTSIRYCDRNEVRSNCIECPVNSHCWRGRLVGCMPNYILVHKERCVHYQKFDVFVNRINTFVSDLSSSLYGFNLCYETSKKVLTEQITGCILNKSEKIFIMLLDQKNIFRPRISFLKNSLDPIFNIEKIEKSMIYI